MIEKLFKNNEDKKTLLFSSLGATLGLLLLLVAVQFYSDITQALNKDSEEGTRYIVIKKRITEFNTLGLKSSSFTEAEIEELKQQSFVKELAPFKSGKDFEVLLIMSLEGGSFPAFSTLAFFETLPDSFIDVKPASWHWKQGDNEVPIILPTTFLDAYNYGIAPSMGAPQAGKSIISSVRFQFRITGYKGQTASFYGRVVDFSDRVNSILVPEPFLDYLNRQYGQGEAQEPSRLIIATDDAHLPELKQYLKERNYEANNEQLKENVMLQVAIGVFYALGGIGIVIVLLSGLNFILYTQVTIAKNSRIVKILLLLGYDYKTIVKAIIRKTGIIYTVVFTVAMVLMWILKILWTAWLNKKAMLELPQFVSFFTFAVGLAFILLFLLWSYKSVTKHVIRIAGATEEE